jgi:glycosyltransferase involved in cell wall biosynthesis
MSKKKLLFVITKGTWGGAQKYVFDLCIAFQNEYDVAVVHGTPGRLVEKLEASQIRTIHISSLGRDVNPLLDIPSFIKLRNIFKKEKADIIHLNSSKIGGLGTLAGRLAGIKNIIFTAHGWAFNEDRGSLSKKIIWLLSWITALFSHYVIVLSSREHLQAHQMPFVHKKIVLIPNGITPPPFMPKEEARTLFINRANIPASDSRLYIGTISELHPNKGLLFALEAMHALIIEKVNLHFFIIGEGEQRTALETKIKQYDLSARVTLLGSIDMAAQYLKAFDMFLLSSLKEGLPYVLLEAAIAEIPIIATEVGGIPEMTNDKAILIPAQDSQAITKAIKELAKDPSRHAKQATELKAYIESHYAVDNMLNSTRKLYQDTV